MFNSPLAKMYICELQQNLPLQLRKPCITLYMQKKKVPVSPLESKLQILMLHFIKYL